MKTFDHRITRATRRWTGWAAIAGTLTLSACGNLTAGGFAEVGVAVSGDAADPAPAPAATTTEPEASSPLLTSHEDEPEGEVEVEMNLFLVSEAGTVTTLNPDEVRVRVDLRGREDVDAAERLVEATTYTELRIVFSEIRAEVESGLVIDGLPVLGDVRVQIDDTSLEVSRQIDLVLGEGERADLLIDLNAAAWLQAVDPITKLVDPSVFAALISVAAR